MGLLNKKETKKKPKVIRMKNGRFVKKEEYDRIISESNKKPKLKKEKLINSKVPEKNQEEKEDEKRKRRMIIIILILLLLFFLFILDIDDLILGIPSEPKVKIPKDKWYQTKVVKIEEDAKSRKKISHYLYCIRQDSNIEKCEWNRTDTKSAEVSTNGINHIWFKGVTEDGKEGKPSKETIVKIDNEAPEEIKVKKTVTETTIKVKVEVKDKETKIEKYYYKIEDGEFEESKKNEYTFKNLKPGTTYKITIKVVDSLGNEKELILNITTKKEKEEDKTEEDTNLENKDNQNNNENRNNNNNNKQTENDTKEEEIPTISLSGVPKIFIIGDNYKLPTSYKFGKSGGKVLCTVDNKEYKDTKNLGIGKKLIKCSAKSNKGAETRVEKEVEIKPETKKETVWDGWITMNLYFPVNSTDWQWRLGREDEVRTGDDQTDWQDYTGPITVRLTDVENVYIRYRLNGKLVVEAPTGKLLVDIEPESMYLKSGGTTNVTINYEEEADKKQYRINGGEWINYTGKFSVRNDTRIEARVVKITEKYDENGEVEETKKETNYDAVYISTLKQGVRWDPEDSSPPWYGTNGGSGSGTSTIEDYVSYGSNYIDTPKYSFAGPIISVKPETLTEEVEVSITTKKEARAIYYKVGFGGKYQKYTEPFKIKKNITIYAYYIENTNGQVSKTTEKYIDNIKENNKPALAIEVSTTKKYQKSVGVSLKASDYNTIEYSLDGQLYYPYTGIIEVTKNCTVYAKAENDYGTTYTRRSITNIGNAPSPEEELDVNIVATPDGGDVDGLINKTKVEIFYDSRAENKYYKLGNGKYQKYTGPIEVNSNTTVVGYATSSSGKGISSKTIDFLTTGISTPVIKPSTYEATTSVEVSIKYDKNANVKKYRIGTGDLMNYTGPFEVDENEVIYAYSKNSLNQESESYYDITNIVEAKRYLLIDMGDYFILRLNYPSNAGKDTREYKWTPTGTWKKYDSQGILLIKKEYKDKLIKEDNISEIKVKDENGKEIIFEDHYYVVDQVSDELMENLFMRWDFAYPKEPSIKLSTTEPTKSLNVTIEYDEYSFDYEYKIEKSDGKDTGWMKYTKDTKIKVKENNTIIYARGISEDGTPGYVGVKKITNIDDEDPDVFAKTDFETPTRSLTIQIVGKDNLGINVVGWGKGKKDVKYFQDVANLQKNNSIFTVEENGVYTLYAEDKVGNTVTKEIEVKNIDKTAPDIAIKELTKEYGTETTLEIDYGDSKTKQYKIGTSGTYQNYTGKFSIKSNDVLQLINDDKTLTVYAKGTDTAGNVQEVSKVIYTLDVDAPATPIINASSGYPTLTEYGVEYDSVASISFDNRNDIENYYSIDNGETWKKYNGPFELLNGVIVAKSVKKNSGLTIQINKDVKMPSDAVQTKALDNDNSTGYVISHYLGPAYTHYLYIDSSVEGKQIDVVAYHPCKTYVTVYFYGASGNVLDSNSYTHSCNSSDITTTSYNVPKGTVKMAVTAGWSGNGGASLNEIRLRKINKIESESIYPKITSQGINKSYSSVNITYYATSIKKLYKIDDGEWKNYKGTIRLNEGETVYAKGIEKDGSETETAQFKFELPSDALKSAAYDSAGVDTYDNIYNSRRMIEIDPSMINKQVHVNAYYNYSGSASSACYIQFYNKNTDVTTTYKTIRRGCRNCTWVNSLVDENITIPEGTTHLIFTGGNGFARIRDLYVANNDNNNDNPVDDNGTKIPNFIESPTINVSDSDKYTATKKVTISYPSGGYTNQYSLDGENWINYTGAINIDKETTIFARSISAGEVISSSSHQITKIDNVKPTISLDEVPNEINIGDDYKLPTTYSFNNNKSGGTVSCTLDGSTEITTTKEISAGIHNIKCSAITGSGIVSTVEKNIEVVDNSEKVPENKETTEESQEETKKEGEESEEEKELNGESTTEESNTNNS